MRDYFREPKFLGGGGKVELDMKKVAGVDISKFAKKVDLANLKSNVDKLDIDKLKILPTNLKNLKSKIDGLDFNKLVLVPISLSKLSDVVKNYVKNNACNGKTKNIENKIPDITNFMI